jgi:hypothetical protein
VIECDPNDSTTSFRFVDLRTDGLQALGFGDVDPTSVQKMENATSENIERRRASGATSATQVSRDHFGPFL